MRSSKQALLAYCLVTGLTASLVLGPATPAAGLALRGRMFNIVNSTREHHGVDPVKLNIELSKFARRHSQRMADRGYLFHSTRVADELRPYTWSSYGEILGEGGTLRQVRDLWMDSPEHRSILLGRSFRKCGVGIVRKGGVVWVTVIFYG